MSVLEQTVREEWGRLTSLLLARYRRLDLVEDALGDAVEAAARRWPSDGDPANPAAWLLTTARRRVVDQLRAEAMVQRKQPLLLTDTRPDEPGPMADPGGLVEDERLRLVLMCAHPALAPDAATALTLRLVLGVTTPDIARLFLVTEPTMAARLTRAKKKIVAAGIPFAVPPIELLPARMEIVARTAYLGFTAGYAPGSGADLLRADLAGEAIRLLRVVLRLRPAEPVLSALLSLVLFQHSRRDARVQAGSLVLLADQDRSRWHHGEIREASDLLGSLSGPLDGLTAEYALQARIAAEHATAATAADTRWDRIVAWYDLLLQRAPGPATRLARAVAVAETFGPRAGLAALEEISLPGSHRLEAVRAELLTRAGDLEAARSAYDRAIASCANEAERDYLERRRHELG